MQAISCPSCGAPLTPAPNSVRVTCSHCGTTTDLTPENVAKIAAVLQRAGVRVSPNLMSGDDIRARIEERAAAENAKRKTAIVWAIVLGTLFCIGLGAALLLMRP